MCLGEASVRFQPAEAGELPAQKASSPRKTPAAGVDGPARPPSGRADGTNRERRGRRAQGVRWPGLLELVAANRRHAADRVCRKAGGLSPRRACDAWGQQCNSSASSTLREGGPTDRPAAPRNAPGRHGEPQVDLSHAKAERREKQQTVRQAGSNSRSKTLGCTRSEGRVPRSAKAAIGGDQLRDWHGVVNRRRTFPRPRLSRPPGTSHESFVERVLFLRSPDDVVRTSPCSMLAES